MELAEQLKAAMVQRTAERRREMVIGALALNHAIQGVVLRALGEDVDLETVVGLVREMWPAFERMVAGAIEQAADETSAPAGPR